MTHVAQVIARDAVKIVGSATVDGVAFGSSVAATDDYMVVGAPLAGIGGTDRGSIYIYERDPVTDLWAEVATFNEASYNTSHFGDCVAVAGDIIVASAPSENSYRGYVYVYHRIAGTWTKTQTITSPEDDTGRTFGRNMMFNSDGSKLVVSHIGSQLKGWAWGYTYNSGTGLFEQSNDYRPGDQADGDCFGCSVAISPNGQHVAVGSYKDSMSVADGGSVVSQAGSVYVSSPGGVHKLRSSAPSAGGFFGRMVGLGNSTLVASAPGEDSSRGHLHVFKWDGANWNHTYRLSAIGGAPSYLLGYQGHQGDGFTIGRCMNHLTVVDDRTAVVPSLVCTGYASGYKGIVWVFDLSTGFAYGYAREAPSTNYSRSNVGSCAAVSKGRLLIGSPLLTEGATATSGVVYETTTEDWDPSYGAVTPDTTAPTVTLVSPPNLSMINPNDPIVVEVTDNVALSHVEIRVRLGGRVKTETVFDGVSFLGNFAALSSYALIGTVHQYTIRRGTLDSHGILVPNSGWTSSVTMTVDAIDTSGNKFP